MALDAALLRALADLLPNAPDFDQPHDRNAWVHYKMGDYPAARLQVDTDRVIPFPLSEGRR